MKKYTEPFKNKMVRLYTRESVPVVHLAEKYKVSPASIYNWIKADKLKNK